MRVTFFVQPTYNIYIYIYNKTLENEFVHIYIYLFSL